MNHLLALSCHSMDVGNMAPVFWAFEERERLMEFYERVSGARMHAAFYRPNDLDWTGLNHQFFVDVALFTRDCFKTLTEIFTISTTNRIWKSRLVNIGSLNPRDILSTGATGPIARSVGIKKDLRFIKSETYAHYWFLSLQGYLGKRGDSYDRFLIRFREMYESLNLIFQLLSTFNSLVFNSIEPSTPKNTDLFSFFESLNSNFYNRLGNTTKYSSMETLIEHFKYYSEGIRIPRGFVYKAVEAPKGEFGVSLVSDGTSKPYRCKIRTPSYHHMQMMSRMSQGHYFADLVTILGTLDIVFGDVDR